MTDATSIPDWAKVDVPDWARTPPAVKPEMTAGETALDAAQSFGIGAAKGTIGLGGMGGDIREAGAGLIGKTGLVSPETASNVIRYLPLMGGPTSQQIRSTIEDATGKFYEPKSATGRYAEFAGELLPAVIGGPETLATKLATRVAVPAIAGQTLAEVPGIKGTAAEPYVKAAGTLTGAVGAAGVTSAVRNAAMPRTNMAADFSRALARDNDTPAAIAQRLQAIRADRPGATIADVAGENVRGLVERVAQTPGAGRTVVNPALTARQQQQMARVTNDLTGLTGTRQSAAQAIEDTMAARSSAADPLYKTAMDFNARDVPEIMRAWTNETSAGWGKAMLNSGDFRRNLQTEYGIADATNSPMMKVIDAWKKVVDGKIGEAVRAGNNNRARILRDMRDRVVGVVDEHNPAYAEARNAWAGPSQYIDAVNDGKGILSKTLTADELRATLRDMTDAQREAYRIGAVAAIRGKMGSDPAKMGDMTKYLRSPEMREKIAALMPTPEAAAAWQRRLDYEIRSSELTNMALRGSPTARRLAERQDAEDLVGDLVWHGLAHMSPKAAFLSFIAGLPARVRDTLRSRTDNLLAGVLTDPNATLPRLPPPSGRLPVGATVYGEPGNYQRAKGGRIWHPAQTGAKKAKDGRWYAKDPNRPGKYLRVDMPRWKGGFAASP